MTLKEVLDIVAEGFPDDDLSQYYDSEGRRNDQPAWPFIDFLISFVTERYEIHRDEPDALHQLDGDIEFNLKSVLTEIQDALQDRYAVK